MFWKRMAILFVPFATAPSSPKKMSIGKVKVEPPPALTFMNPARTPKKNNRNNWKYSVIKF